MAQYNSMRKFANKYRKLADPNGIIAINLLLAHAEIGRTWKAQSQIMMQRRIYGRYIPTNKEYRETKSKSQVQKIARDWRDGGGRNPNPRNEDPIAGKGKAWKRTHELFNNIRMTVTIHGISMTNSARNVRGRQYAAARHNLGTDKSPIKNSIWTLVVQFQTEPRNKLFNSGYVANVYKKWINKALSIQ